MAEIVTGEAVVLDVPVAAFPSRLAAVLIDLVVQYTALVLVLVIAANAVTLDAAALGAVATVAFVLVIVGYPTIFETLSRGKTLGKMALGIRVVGDDGGPERFRQALIRALAGIFEFTILAPVALITSLISARGKRVGDIFAGTCVIQERVPRRRELAWEFATVPPPLADWARSIDISALSDATAEAAGSYLRRLPELQPAAIDELGARLAGAVAAQVSPPPPFGTPPIAYLTAVLAVRRARDYARMAATSAPAARPSAAPAQAVPWPAVPGPATPWPTVPPPWPAPAWPAPAVPPPRTSVPAPAAPVAPPVVPAPAVAASAGPVPAPAEPVTTTPAEAEPGNGEPAEAPRFAPPV